jgi:hypothetical protein
VKTPTITRRTLLFATVLTAAVFLLSAILNFGVKIPLGFAELRFSAPLASTGTDELVIGIVLLIAAAISRLYVYGAALILAMVGIASGLLSPEVQGQARELHEVMLPLVILACVMLALEARSAFVSRTDRSASKVSREATIVLQFFVGGLVVLGGLAYAANGTYPLGTVLGGIHLAVGIVGLYAGYAALKWRTWPRTLLVAINGVTIVYSAFSESAAQLYSLLPPGVNDSLIGTLIAIIASCAIIYLVLSKGPMRQPVKAA